MYGKMQKSGSTEIIPWIRGQYPGLLISLLTVYHWSCCSRWLIDGGHPGSILSSPRAHHLVTVMWWLDGCGMLCLLTWQAIFFIHTVITSQYASILSTIWHSQSSALPWKLHHTWPSLALSWFHLLPGAALPHWSLLPSLLTLLVIPALNLVLLFHT